MKEKILFFTFFFLSLFLAVAQNNDAWAPVKLDVAGHNIVNGVEVSFQKSMCNGEEVIFVKFNNSNKFPVTIKWYDAILTQANGWVKKDGSTPKKTLNIDAGKEIKGDCVQENLECLIKLKDYIDRLSDYQLYATYRFEVSEIKK
jgi:hypothetical protein